jgi:hypothetical protein
MKKIFATIALAVVSLASFAQTNRNGTPDMRFKVNQQLYGGTSQRTTSYPTNTSTYNTPSYSTPRNVTPSYSTPSYSTPSTNYRSNQAMPQNNNGSLDMRYNRNRYPYGR